MCGVNRYFRIYKGCRESPKHLVPQTDFPILELCDNKYSGTEKCPNIHPSVGERFGKTPATGPCPTCEVDNNMI